MSQDNIGHDVNLRPQVKLKTHMSKDKTMKTNQKRIMIATALMSTLAFAVTGQGEEVYVPAQDEATDRLPS